MNYDLNDDPELVWGLGLGCGGSVHVLLTRLDAGAGLDALQQLFAGIEAGQDGALAVVYESCRFAAGGQPRGARGRGQWPPLPSRLGRKISEQPAFGGQRGA